MITYLIIGITAVVSFLAFQNVSLMEKLQFNAAQVVHRKQYYRLISHAFVHVSWTHLIVNMLVLYFFGRNVETYFGYFFGNKAVFYFIMLYLGGMLASNVWSL
ncbi:MAG TPA: rhomboid family intramembrane serine protease, partial [Mariniphaga anaerophila]|nr:rhomboid family intramembrane serine protease [Mariniphaga anaerophila]